MAALSDGSASFKGCIVLSDGSDLFRGCPTARLEGTVFVAQQITCAPAINAMICYERKETMQQPAPRAQLKGWTSMDLLQFGPPAFLLIEAVQ